MPALEKYVLVIVATAGIAYGLVDLFAPAIAIRWQVRSTARAKGINRRIGVEIGAFISQGVDEPWNDQGARRRVRVIGACLVFVMSMTMATVVAIEAT